MERSHDVKQNQVAVGHLKCSYILVNYACYIKIEYILDDAFGKQCSEFCPDGMVFTTYDQDNDNYADGSCAESYQGAWWYNGCFKCCLNSNRMIWFDASELVTLHQSMMMITD